jgi:hypothetical protein
MCRERPAPSSLESSLVSYFSFDIRPSSLNSSGGRVFLLWDPLCPWRVKLVVLVVRR